MRILLFANTDWYLYNFRLSMARQLRQAGHEVIFVSPPGAFHEQFIQAGFQWFAFPLSRRGMNPFEDSAVILRFARLCRRIRPDLVHNHTIKCVLYGSLGARLAGVRGIVNSITGMGWVFSAAGLKGRLLQVLVKLLYRAALRKAWVVFENPDDQAEFLRSGLVQSRRAVLVRSVGVELDRFSPRPEPAGPPLVVFASRLLWDKGVGDFVEAARVLQAWRVQARFVLAGDTDPDNPSAVPAVQLHAWRDSGVVEWWGWQANMSDVYADANLVCLPSRYREGIPKTLIEAAACGRAIVATDMPGCREAVKDGLNGLLVPPGDVPALAQALRRLIESPGLRQEMGSAGRTVAVEEFSLEKVVNETWAVYEKAWG